ncbi:hypothetical protein APY94_09105 [Thermococcus celericrescens]|uniref:Adhesin domain-containing protein n=1 Tax=Thermococcus celericrescens TaxID=227598 RepID=A0A100XWS8_9EURY|nr:hypothetical protein [Thermococcus celericrescens]KUH32667.1 hypothetical protein APY94_09105 [Thermococcus celericrescens]
MRRKGGALGVVLGVALAVLLIGAVLTVLAIRGDISIDGITPKKVAGKVVEFGEFNAPALEVREVVGDVSIVGANVSKITVKSNLPINVSLENGVLTVYCPTKKVGISHRNVCNDYRNGTVVVEVPEKLLGLRIDNVVGDVLVAAESTGVDVTDVVGEVRGTSRNDYHLSDIVGDVYLNVAEGATISDVVGDVKIAVPEGFGAALTAKDIVGDVTNTAAGKNGTVVVIVTDVVGDVEIKR